MINQSPQHSVWILHCKVYEVLHVSNQILLNPDQLIHLFFLKKFKEFDMLHFENI